LTSNKNRDEFFEIVDSNLLKRSFRPKKLCNTLNIH
jgi:hypothetical protein